MGSLACWWLSLLLIVILVVVFVIARNKKFSVLRWISKREKSKPIANTSALRSSSTYQRHVRHTSVLLSIVFVLGSFGLLASLVLAGRYSTTSIEQPEVYNRDIILCLDVSGSMIETDRKIVQVFNDLTDGLKGQRVGVVLFNSSATTYFPLINDYDYAKERLSELESIFGDVYGNLNSTIWNDVLTRKGASLVGDGLASCLLRFDKQNTDRRARSVVLATDNFVYGEQIVTLEQAGALAKQRGVRVYGINPADHTSYLGVANAEAQEMHDVLLDTGGDYYKLDVTRRSDDLVKSIVNKINEQEATRFKGSPILMISDRPTLFIAICTVATLAIVAVAWRLRL